MDLWLIEIQFAPGPKWNVEAVYEDQEVASKRFSVLSEKHESAGVRLTKYVPFDHALGPEPGSLPQDPTTDGDAVGYLAWQASLSHPNGREQALTNKCVDYLREVLRMVGVK